jgi:hypothetical protein
MKAQYNKLIKRLDMIEAEKERLEVELDEMNKELAKMVQQTVKGKTITLTVGKRVVKAAELGGRIRGYKITEGEKVLQREYRGSIYGLKILLALGAKEIGYF